MGQGLVHGSVRDPATSVGQVKVIRSQSLRAAGEGRVNVQIHKADPGGGPLRGPSASRPTAASPGGLPSPRLLPACTAQSGPDASALASGSRRGSGWAEYAYLSPQLQQQHWRLR